MVGIARLQQPPVPKEKGCKLECQTGQREDMGGVDTLAINVSCGR